MLMHVRTALLTGALMVPAGLVHAQTTGMDQSDRQQSQRSTQQAGMQGSATASSNAADRQTQQQLVQMLIMGNQAEIELGQLAERRAQNNEVKQFAKQMQEDHQQFLQQLQRAGGAQAMGGADTQQRLGAAGGMTAAAGAETGNASAAGGASVAENRDRGASAGPNAGIQDRDSTTGAGNDLASASRSGELGQMESGTTGAADADGHASSQVYGFAAGGQGGLAQVLQEYHQQHMQSTRQMLSEKQGSDFDKAYIGNQIMMHQSMLDKLQVFGRHVDQNTQQVLQQGQQSVREHLQHARQIMQQLDKQG